MFLNCIHYSEQEGSFQLCFMLNHLKRLLKTHRITTDITNDQTPLVTPVHINRGEDTVWCLTQPKRLHKPSVRPMPLWKPAPPPNRPPDGPRWTNGLRSRWCHCPPETRSQASIQSFKGQKRKEHVRSHLLQNSQCCGWWYFSGAVVVKLGLGGLFSLGHFSASKFVFQSCSSATAGRHGEAETHVWKTTCEEKGPKLHKTKRTVTFLKVINYFIYYMCVNNAEYIIGKLLWVGGQGYFYGFYAIMYL